MSFTPSKWHSRSYKIYPQAHIADPAWQVPVCVPKADGTEIQLSCGRITRLLIRLLDKSINRDTRGQLKQELETACQHQ